jgi:hypothetical protein
MPPASTRAGGSPISKVLIRQGVDDDELHLLCREEQVLAA